MCIYCAHTQEEREKARFAAQWRIEQLERMISHLNGLADGRIKPHTKEAAAIQPTAHALIRWLVEDEL